RHVDPPGDQIVYIFSFLELWGCCRWAVNGGLPLPFGLWTRQSDAWSRQNIEQIRLVADIGDGRRELHCRNINKKKHAAAGAGLGAAGNRRIAAVRREHDAARTRRSAVGR